MVLTSSTMLKLGTEAPDFLMMDTVASKKVNLNTFKNSALLLVMFISVHCPYVKHIEKKLPLIRKDFNVNDVGVLAISSNDIVDYPEDSPEKLKKMAQRLDLNFPLCYDETQEVAKAYSAACTPDFFIFDRHRKLGYRGQFDDSRPENGLPVTGESVREAIQILLKGDSSSILEQKASIGCNIKWKKGNEPHYFS